MYISLHSCECDYPTATPYKKFPIAVLLENIACLLDDHSDSELEPLKELESTLQNTQAKEREQALINYIYKNGTQNPNHSMTTEIDIECDYYRFHLAYNKTSFYHYAYSGAHEDWESRITYHEEFKDEEN